MSGQHTVPRTTPIGLFVVLAVLAVAALAALVILELAGKDTSPVTTFVGPIIGAIVVAVGAGAYVGNRLDSQDSQLVTIADNTNGKLDGRIADQVHRVLQAHGIPGPHPGDTPPAAPPER